MMLSKDSIASAEEEVLITAVSDLILYICQDDEELIELEDRMTQSVADLEKLHPRYCLTKANLINEFLKACKRGKRNVGH